MATTKISITLDTDRLEELKSLAGAGISLSAVIDDALRIELHRLRMKALLDEMDAQNPISPEEHAAGRELWQRMQSSLTQVRSLRSRKKWAASATRSKKR